MIWKALSPHLLTAICQKSHLLGECYWRERYMTWLPPASTQPQRTPLILKGVTVLCGATPLWPVWQGLHHPRCQGPQRARLVRTILHGTGQQAQWQPAPKQRAQPFQAQLRFHCRHQQCLVPCPVPTLITSLPLLRRMGERFLSPECELGEKSRGPRGRAGKGDRYRREEKRFPLTSLDALLAPRESVLHLHTCSNVTKDRHSSLSCPVYPQSRNSPWRGMPGKQKQGPNSPPSSI